MSAPHGFDEIFQIGLAVQGGSKTQRHLDGLLHVISPEDELRLVHRLDRDTSGCLVLGRTRESAAALSHAFKEGRIKKTYMALVSPCPSGPKHGTIDAPLYKRRGSAGEPDRVVAVATGEGGQSAITHYNVLASGASGACSFALLRLVPVSGRTHQLRVHCAHVLQSPIIGDTKYSDIKSTANLMMQVRHYLIHDDQIVAESHCRPAAGGACGVDFVSTLRR